jgi:hypothetical protein
MFLVTLLAYGAGLGSGLIAAGLSIAGSKRWVDDGFWQRLRAFGRLLLSPESEDRLFQEYVRLWPALFAFTGRKLALGVVAVAPVALAFFGLTLLDGAVREAQGAINSSSALSSARDWEYPFFAAACLASLAAWCVARFKA